jgi:hypothetical protein
MLTLSSFDTASSRSADRVDVEVLGDPQDAAAVRIDHCDGVPFFREDLRQVGTDFAQSDDQRVHAAQRG